MIRKQNTKNAARASAQANAGAAPRLGAEQLPAPEPADVSESASAAMDAARTEQSIPAKDAVSTESQDSAASREGKDPETEHSVDGEQTVPAANAEGREDVPAPSAPIEPATSHAKADDAQSSTVTDPAASGSDTGAKAPVLINCEVISPLDYNNRRFEIGDDVHLPEDIARTLLLGSVVRVIE